MVVLVTGGAGFVGSHTCKALAMAGVEPVVLDNLATGHRKAVCWGPFVEGDLLIDGCLDEVFAKYKPDAILHFAASAYVGESVTAPEKYYRNNVVGTLNLLASAARAGIDKIIFSSSCATYGTGSNLPISEDTPQIAINPYGRTKIIGEWMLSDFAAAARLRYVSLRYFNAAGADPEGQIGEWHDPETHLIPRVLLAAAGKIEALDIFGSDYPTLDGTCIRDYIHVSDLANAHVDAYTYLKGFGASVSLNLGNGRGYSVLDVVTSVETLTGRRVPVAYRPRRSGDPSELLADATRAKQVIGFSPRYSDLPTIINTAAPFFLPHDG